MKDIYKEVSAMSDVVDAMQQGFQDIAFAGDGQKSSVTGTTFAPDTNDYIWATVQPASNTTLANGSAGIPHAWAQIVPQANGNTGTTNTMLSGTENSNAAYGANASFLTSNTTTKLYPVTTRFDNSTNTTQTQWWFEAPGNGSSDVVICRVSGGPYNSGNSVWYDSHIATRGVSNGVVIDGTTVFLRQIRDIPLTVGNSNVSTGGCYTSLRDGNTTINTGSSDVSRMTYITAEFPGLGANCSVVN